MEIRRTLNRLPPPYAPSVSLSEAAAELGIPVRKVIKLDSGENLFLPRLNVDWQQLGNQAALYPNISGLRAALAQDLGVDISMVALGNGSDELIDLVCRLFLEPGKTLLDFPPTFPMYRFFATVMGAQIIDVPRTTRFGLAAAASRAALTQADLTFIANPNNPTGTLVPLETIRQLLATGKPVVVDEAYVEFSGETVLPLLAEFPNLIILRTFSKWAGLAGLRIGYMVANPTVIENLLKIRPPYSVNSFALAAALVALANKKSIMNQIRRQIAARDWFISQVNQLDSWRAIPSRASCITLLPQRISAQAAAIEFRKKGILVKVMNMSGTAIIRINTAPRSVLRRVLAVMSQMKGC